jgi:FtsZ-interacting cell division protein ZipA
MSDLQISLLAAGAVVVAGVYLFNVWQERQFRRRSEQAFARKHEDVLLQGAATQEKAAAERVEPKLEVTAPSATPAGPRVPVKAHTPLAIDPVIDYVIEVTLPDAADGAELHTELIALSVGWGKPVLVAAYAAAGGEWQPAGIDGGGRSSQLRFALQLSNRAGCVEQNQLTAFRDAVRDWCERNRGSAQCPDVAEAHAMAVQIDRFCADVDIAIGINVVTRGGSPFSGTKIRALAESSGLRLEPDGVFYLRGDYGDMRFTLDNHEPMPFVPEQMKTLSTGGITFLLDVPRVADALRAFDTMLGMARSFAAALDGILVDDKRSALSDSAIATIRQQLEAILAKMEAGHIEAGGARALRLFS